MDDKKIDQSEFLPTRRYNEGFWAIFWFCFPAMLTIFICAQYPVEGFFLWLIISIVLLYVVLT